MNSGLRSCEATHAVFTRDTFTWGKCHFTVANVTQYNRNVLRLQWDLQTATNWGMNLALLEAGHLRVQFIPGPLYEDSEMMCIWLISPVQSYELFPGLSLQLYSYPQFIYMIDLIWTHQTYGMAQYWLNIQIMTRMELVVSQINRPRETLGVKAPGTGV